MPLFRVNLAEVEGLDEEGVVVVHEGDGPKALAKAALRYYREQRAAHCVTDGSGAHSCVFVSLGSIRAVKTCVCVQARLVDC